MEIKERPILFRAPMVRALLSGQKTVTRRVVKVQPFGAPTWNTGYLTGAGERDYVTSWLDEAGRYLECPYGNRGEMLWVRESYQVSKKYDSVKPSDLNYERGISTYYAAGGSRWKDGSGQYVDNDDVCTPDWVGKMRPSIFMPRAASRILLEITDVRVERLQDISDDQAKAEGIEHSNALDPAGPCKWRVYGREHTGTSSPVDSFESLWSSINGADAWAANPWVWVVEFKRVMA